MTCVSGLDQVRRGGRNSDTMHNTRVFLNRVCLQGLHVRFIVCLFVCLFVCFIASQLHATAVIRYTHIHTHRHTQKSHTHTQTIPSDLGSALPLSAHTRIHAHSTPLRLNVSVPKPPALR